MQTLPAWNRRSARDDSDVLPMLVRESYKKLSEIMYKHVMDRAVVTGMPGVGKSWFVDYFAWHCIQKGDAVILECDDDTLVNESRRVELLVPKVVQSTGPAVAEIEIAWQINTQTGMEEISQQFNQILGLIDNRKCWNLIDNHNKGWKRVFGDRLNARRALFVPPDRKR